MATRAGEARARTTNAPPSLAVRSTRKNSERLHAELVQVQHWVQRTGAKICIVFEGRDGAGKGGAIKAITERVSPRVFRVVALPAPTEREKSQMYAQRYIRHLPAAGEIVIFDRSWYNRAGVERVMGFCTEEEAQEFLEAVPLVERAVVESGVLLLKYWLEVSPEEQTRRLQDRINDPRKIWKLSPMDLKSYSRWYDYSRARDEMFAATDLEFAPWYVARSDDKKRARLNIIAHLLSKIPYERHEAGEDQAAGAPEAPRLPRARASTQIRSGAVLNRSCSAQRRACSKRLNAISRLRACRSRARGDHGVYRTAKRCSLTNSRSGCRYTPFHVARLRFR